MATIRYTDNVFINCPFDDLYKSLFYAIIFTIFDCGYVARSAVELDDASQVRVEKIMDIINDSKFGIHDISRTELDSVTGLPRFNMPLELGFFLSAKRFGEGHHKEKVCLIFDREPFRYQKFISDISGQDIKAHNNEPENVVKLVRNWLRNSSRRGNIPGGAAIWKRYVDFRDTLPKMCSDALLDEDDLTFNDYCFLVSEWLNKSVT